MPATSSPSTDGLPWRLLLLVAAVAVGIAAYVTLGTGLISLEALVRHRIEIDTFVSTHQALVILAYLALYVVIVGLSVPGATFLTVVGGFLFGTVAGGVVSVIGATAGALIIFLIARTALGEPLLAWAGPRVQLLAAGFRANAFSYLLFLRLVPAFPFFLVNLVSAIAGVRLDIFIVTTFLGVIPASFAFALAGTGLDSVIMAQKDAFEACIAGGRSDCHMAFDARDALTPELLAALLALGLLALLPALARRLRAK